MTDSSPADLEFGERRQRLCRLLGTEAILALDLADSEPGDLDQLDNVHRPQLDENLNRKAGPTLTSRAQDYSTTSLEFSDVDSLVSDSVGRQSDDDATWNHYKRHSVEELGQEPLSFVEFAPANEDSDDHLRHSRSVPCFL